jgi:eukaryotic-like serine/threonine-protein kinase
LGGAIFEYRSAVKLLEQTVDDIGASSDDLAELAYCHNDLAWLLATCFKVELRNPTEAVEHAMKSVELAPTAGGYWNTLGVAHYRAGDWNASIGALEKSIGLREPDSNDWFFLAMANWQLGQNETAKKWYDQAVVWMEMHQPRNKQLARFRAEADELLGKEMPPLNESSKVSK